ncbi:auxin-induced in root cultures protein 12 [Dorcoceras hygrometricum]|uniref:Auxin-induced in root cultures protein 12 n=1 Tax=Dorcoceras hygrometricum TaxID=472368 RepID=A0A2Z6ZZ15_9LAMI|nr:auxin-induced in root cultures protein 12 [Dorcoceras hygrometricum]
MAAVSSIFLIAAVASLCSPAAAATTCKSQTFSNNVVYSNSTELPTLKACLHWTYDPAAKPNPTLAIAFVAPPAKSEGWVAWALNPKLPAMIGSQALVAFKESNGSAVVKTYNISSYGFITESKISYEVLEKRAEYSNGVFRIFAKLVLPEAEVVNQVWQVGGSVKDGVPQKHAFSGDNLASKGTLQLTSHGVPSPAPSPSPSPSSSSGSAGAPPPQSGTNDAGSLRFGLSGVLGLIGASILML